MLQHGRFSKIRSHMNFKGLVMALCTHPCAAFIDQSFLMIYSTIFYGKELTCQEAMDSLACFNRHTSFLNLKYGGFVYHAIFIYIYNWLAMTNKMAARVLTYKLGLPSYGDSKLEKWIKNIT